MPREYADCKAKAWCPQTYHMLIEQTNSPHNCICTVCNTKRSPFDTRFSPRGNTPREGCQGNLTVIIISLNTCSLSPVLSENELGTLRHIASKTAQKSIESRRHRYEATSTYITSHAQACRASGWLVSRRAVWKTGVNAIQAPLNLKEQAAGPLLVGCLQNARQCLGQLPGRQSLCTDHFRAASGTFAF